MQNRIREFREQAGLSMQALAERAGTSAPQINKLEKGERRLTVDWMIKLGRALGVDPRALLPPEIGPPLVTGPSDGLSDRELVASDLPTGERAGTGSGLPPGLRAMRLDLGKPDLPVLGRAQGGTGVLMIPAEAPPADWTYRPPQLRAVPDAFAVFAYDDSMHPMYKHGQTLWVHPYLPAKPGDGVLIIKTNDEALIKELVRRTDHDVVLRQYRPIESEFSLPAREVRALYRVVGALDLR